MKKTKPTIGFAYSDLVIANICNNVFRDSGLPEPVRLLEGVQMASRVGIVTTVDILATALRFVKKRGDTYSTHTPVELAVCQLLTSEEFFPEDPKDFREILATADGKLSKDAKVVFDLHDDLLMFWQQFVVHKRSYEAIEALLQAFGAEHTKVFTDDGYPCLYHRGMSVVDPEVQLIVSVYEHYKNFLGFTPALLFGNEFMFPPLATLLIDISSPDVTVNAPTLAGRIWFEGMPDSDQPGGPKVGPVH